MGLSISPQQPTGAGSSRQTCLRQQRVSVSRKDVGMKLREYGKRMMAEGTIKRITNKGFGFIEEDGKGKDMFFHSSNVEGTHFDDLQEGQRVSYTVGQGPKGPRAENVRVI